jgi:hypothetical protein
MSFFEAMFGDDFPDAFAHDGRSCKSKKTILDLPAELLKTVCQYLLNPDMKKLRLACRELAEKVELRIECVYVSPNRANLDCLNNILNHPRYCLQVQELVWDDSQLQQLPTFESFRDCIALEEAQARMALEDHLSTLFRSNAEDGQEHKTIGVRDCVGHDGELTDIGKAILLDADDETSKSIIASRASSMSIEESYVLYQKLYQDETEIIKRGWDVLALSRAVEQLPNLRRVTITTEAWRPWNLRPIYDTPFHRALPIGFRKPSVWPWLHWDTSDLVDPLARTEERGYSILVSLLATRPILSLQEFVVDTGRQCVGLPLELFALPKLDYTNSVRAFSTAPLKRLQLSIVEQNPRTYNGPLIDLLKGVISATPNLEDLDLTYSTSSSRRGATGELFDENFLQTRCPGLKRIALRLAKVMNNWLCNVIKSLENLERVVLDRIEPEYCASISDIVFYRLRQHYAAQCSRGPILTWIETLGDHSNPEKCRLTSRWLAVVEEELNAFLYDGGEFPLTWLDPALPYQPQRFAFIKPNVGWIMDARDSTIRTPNTTGSAATAMATTSPWPVYQSTAICRPQRWADPSLAVS